VANLPATRDARWHLALYPRARFSQTTSCSRLSTTLEFGGIKAGISTSTILFIGLGLGAAMNLPPGTEGIRLRKPTNTTDTPVAAKKLRHTGILQDQLRR
jgi:hypothetical protein